MDPFLWEIFLDSKLKRWPPEVPSVGSNKTTSEDSMGAPAHSKVRIGYNFSFALSHCRSIIMGHKRFPFMGDNFQPCPVHIIVRVAAKS